MEENTCWNRITGANIDETILCSPQSAKVRYANREIEYITVFQHEDEDGAQESIMFINKCWHSCAPNLSVNRVRALRENNYFE